MSVNMIYGCEETCWEVTWHDRFCISNFTWNVIIFWWFTFVWCHAFTELINKLYSLLTLFSVHFWISKKTYTAVFVKKLLSYMDESSHHVHLPHNHIGAWRNFINVCVPTGLKKICILPHQVFTEKLSLSRGAFINACI